RQDQVQQQAVPAQQSQEHKQQPHQGRVHVKILGQPGAHAEDHLIVAAIELLARLHCPVTSPSTWAAGFSSYERGPHFVPRICVCNATREGYVTNAPTYSSRGSPGKSCIQ